MVFNLLHEPAYSTVKTSRNQKELQAQNAQTSQGKEKDIDIYDYEYSLANAHAVLSKCEAISDEDKASIREFDLQLVANGVSLGRRAKYIFHLKKLGEYLGCDFKKANKKDIEGVVTWLHNESYTPHTVSDYIQIMKRFWKYLRYGNTDLETPYPEEVRWLRTVKKDNATKTSAG
jgi:hypothetical protein